MVDKELHARVQSLLSDENGKATFTSFLHTVLSEIGIEKLKEGVLVGLSGGADSVMLLCCLWLFKNVRGENFSILCAHVDHGIRGEESTRDMDFSRELCKMMDVDFVCKSFDVPALSRLCGDGVEQTARDVRYSYFNEIISGRDDISRVAVAHNSSDNSETVLFNLSRGSSLKGICGIPVVRDNVIRPLLRVDSKTIRDALDGCNIPYVNDSTNFTNDYSRNYIRHEILPRLDRVFPSASLSIARMTRSVSLDSDYLDNEAKKIFSALGDDIRREELIALHPALLSRVLILLHKAHSCESLSFHHIEQLLRGLENNNFSIYLPGEIIFSCHRGIISIRKRNEKNASFPQTAVGFGETVIPNTNGVIILSNSVIDSSSNIYKFSIHADLSSAIINGDLFVRPRADGDSYRYGGMTHKLKKVFNDKNIHPEERDRIPVLCDSSGILWVPGLGVRDDGVKLNGPYVAFCTNEVRGDEIQLCNAILRK